MGWGVYDFVVSFAEPDRAWAEWIAAELSARGHRPLLYPAAQQAGSAAAAADAIWIPLMSHSSGPDAIPAAWWWIGPDGEVDPQVRPIIVTHDEDCDPSWLDLAAIASDHEEAQAAAALCSYLGAASRPGHEGAVSLFGSGSPLYPPEQPKLWNIPARNPHLIGRDETLGQLREGFLLNPGMPQAVVGGPGIGTTVLAIEYAHRHHGSYQGCWWIDAAPPPVIEVQLAALTQRLARTAPNGHDRPSLLILDGTADAGPAASSELPGHWHVLMTANDVNDGNAQPVTVGPLSRADSLRLLRQLFPGISQALAERIAGLSTDVPLAMKLLAAAAAAERDRPIDELCQPVADALAIDQSAAVQVITGAALETLGRVHPAAMELLEVLAQLAPAPVPVAALHAGARVAPAALSADLRSEPDLRHLADPLVRAAFAWRTPEALVLQAAVRHAVTETASAERLRTRTGQAANLTAAAARTYDHRKPPSSAWDALLAHLLAVSETAVTLPTAFPAATVADYLHNRECGSINPADVIGALDAVGRHYARRDQPGLALSLAERALRLAEQHAQEHPVDLATRLVNLAARQRLSGDPAGALELLQRARKIATAAGDRLPGDETRLAFERPNLLVELALTHRALGEHETALSFLDRLWLLARHGGVQGRLDHREVAQVHAGLLQAAGRPGEAREMLQEYLPERPEELTGQDEVTALMQRDLAAALLELGRPEESLAILSSCVPALLRYFTDESSHAAEALTLQAAALVALTRADEAVAVSREAVVIAERALSADVLGYSLAVHADANLLAGQVETALALHRRVIDVADRAVWPAGKRADVRRRYAQASLNTGETDKAAEVLEEALGLLASSAAADPEREISLLGDLAHAELKRNRPQVALKLLECAEGLISGDSKPPEPVVLATLSLLGQALNLCRRPAEAISVLRSACLLAERTYGPRSSDVLRLQGALALAYNSAGQPDEALELCDRAIAACPGPGSDVMLLSELGHARGQVLLSLGSHAEALKAFDAAVRATERAVGLVHMSLADQLSNVGIVLLNSGDPAQASTRFGRALQIYRDLFGGESLAFADCLDNLARSWVFMGYPAEAVPLHRQALQITELHLGPSDPVVAIRLHNLGLALVKAEDPSAAIPHLRRAVSIDEAVYGPNHAEVATDLQILAQAFDLAGRSEEARRCRGRIANMH